MKQLQHVIRLSKNFRQLFQTCQHQQLCPHRHVHALRQLSVTCHQSVGNTDILPTVSWDPGTTALCTTLRQCTQFRSLVTSPIHEIRSNVGVGSGQHHLEEELSQLQTVPQAKPTGVPDTAWAVRLANENGYLSWCRNTYLASAVACGMQAEGAFEISQVAAQGVFILAGINLIWGTTSFVAHILALRRRVQMSLLATLMNISGAVLHLLTWLTLVTMYLGLTEEQPEHAEENHIQGDDV